MSHLICGRGEIGKSLKRVLQPFYKIVSLDKNEADFADNTPIEVMHICFGYSDKFISEVKRYQEKYKPKYTVIHSTVPVGTSRQCGATHSPCRGMHPYLEEGIKTFVKFIGGEQASEVSHYFRRAGLKVILFDKQETTEAGKILDTEYYRHCIEFAHKVKKYCIQHDLNFHEVYTLFNQTYNSGYSELGHSEFIRPVLQPIMTPIGGHCVLQNKDLIKYE